MATMRIRTKKKLKPIVGELFFDDCVVGRKVVSEVVPFDVLFAELLEVKGGTLLLVDWETEAGAGVDCPLDGLVDGGVVVVGEDVSVEDPPEEVFILGGVGGVGLVGGVGDCISKPPLHMFVYIYTIPQYKTEFKLIQ